jgi:putative ABC transport system permease protein
MNLGFSTDFLLTFFAYLPLATGAYISILILRYPDLTIEASWSLGAISSCILAACLPGPIAPLSGLIVGGLCGVLTSVIFSITGRVKLLAGLISYYILEALGFHLLGDKASIYLNHSFSGFGFPENRLAGFLIYGVIASTTLLIVLIWQKSLLGVKSRLLGENPRSSIFFRLSLDKYFALGLIFSNALVGLGGGLWGMYYGQASNVQGIGLVLKAFLALLLGDELLRILKVSKRAVPLTAALGTFIFVFLAQSSEFIQAGLARRMIDPWFKPTDKQILIAVVLIGLLWARRKTAFKKGAVSEW